MTEPGAETGSLVRRRVAVLGFIAVVLGFLVWFLVEILMALHLRDRVDLWLFGVALVACIFICLLLFVAVLKALLKRRPSELGRSDRQP